MRVRLKVDISGTRDGTEWPRRGAVIDLPDGEAAEYCRAGMAEPVATFTAAEHAVLPSDEERRDSHLPKSLTTQTGPSKRRKS